MSAVTGGEPRALAPGARQPIPVPRRLLRMRSDAALAERVAVGDETAFDVLYERHRPVVLAVCMGVLGTAHDAEDATQETFTALSIALRNNIPAELRPWLIRVARNASIDTTRRRKHRLLTLDGELPDIPARPAAGKAEFEVVMDGIRELPEQQRTALLMRELGGHSYAEIGDFMELDEDAVRGLIARARVGLRSYREATELPCATARACIETEPDGRRYDKTIRRHLRGCPSCRSYRTALRGDAKALRAALPFQACAFGTATTGLATGALSASKAALLGAGMSQIAATCAASVCAVGTVGGMVLIAPVHHILSDHLRGPVAAVVVKPHHPHHAHVAAVVHKPAIAPVSTYVAPETSASIQREKSTVAAARHEHKHRHHASATHTKISGVSHQSGSTSTPVQPSANPTPVSTKPAVTATSGSPSGGTTSGGGTTGAPTSTGAGSGSSWGGRSTVNTSAPGSGTSGVGGTSGTTGTSGTGGTSGTTGTSGTPTGGTTTPVTSTTSTTPVQSPVTSITGTVNATVQTIVTTATGQNTTTSTTPTPSTPVGLTRRRTAPAPGSTHLIAPTGGEYTPASPPGQHLMPPPTSAPNQHTAPFTNTNLTLQNTIVARRPGASRKGF
jgi:RNA polymerase sigma factor (sigma-70 family)